MQKDEVTRFEGVANVKWTQYNRLQQFGPYSDETYHLADRRIGWIVVDTFKHLAQKYYQISFL